MSVSLEKSDPSRPLVFISRERCVGCLECLRECPTGCLTLDFSRFTVRADSAECVGCRQCQRTCPLRCIVVTGPFWGLHQRTPSLVLDQETRLSSFREVDLGYTDQEAALEAARCLVCPRPRCRDAGCPAHNDIPAMCNAIVEGDLPRARDVLAATTLLPAVCGRVCDQANLCEGACVYRREGGQAVSIGRLERYVGDWAVREGYRKEHPAAPASGFRVAVVGSGPAGLAAAERLARLGHAVTVYDVLPVAGGVLSWGIPGFSLPFDVVAAVLEEVEAAGVEFRLETQVGAGGIPLESLLEGNDAVFLAAGAGRDNVLNVPGAGLPGASTATAFLTAAKLSRSLPHRWQAPRVGENVLVIGAGNTALDVARSARRLGAKTITAIDILPETLAPIRPDELEAARNDGVQVRFAHSLVALEGTGRVERAALIRMRAVSGGGKPQPMPVPGSEFRIPVQTVVFALGYRVSSRVTAGTADLSTTARGTVTADENGRTSREKLWAGGDVVTGPGVVVRAMVAGRRAARDIDRALQGG